MNTRTIITSGLLSCLMLNIAIMMSGCQSLGLLPGKSSFPEASEQNPVVEMICLWEAAEGIGTDGLPTRGFAGQILFFTANDKEPVKMDGDIRVFVFDDQGEEEAQGKPLHQFDFDSTAFQTFMHDTNLGGAYQLFIPYTRKGGHSATCSIRIRLTPPNGQAIYSKMASVVLPGTKPEKSNTTISGVQKPERTIQQMSHEIVATESVVKDLMVRDLRTESLPGVKVKKSTVDDDRRALRSRLAEISDQTPQVSQTDKSTLKRKPVKPNLNHPLLRDAG